MFIRSIALVLTQCPAARMPATSRHCPLPLTLRQMTSTMQMVSSGNSAF
jgi:hypothetical protein